MLRTVCTHTVLWQSIVFPMAGGLNNASARRKGQRKDYHFKLFKTPKEASNATMIAGENKARYGFIQVLILSFVGKHSSRTFSKARSQNLTFVWTLGGAIIAIGTHASLQAGSIWQELPPGENSVVNVALIRRLTTGIVLPVGLVALILMGCDLYTGNCMITSLSLLCRVASPWGWFLNMSLSLIGNFAGCARSVSLFFKKNCCRLSYLHEQCLLSVAALLSYWSDLYPTGSVQWKYLQAVATSKTSQSFLQTWTRAIGANLCVCAAVFMAIAAEDVLSKIASVYICISAMVVSGFEHLIINFFVLMTALMYDSPTTNFGEVMYKNWLPTFFGNTVSGVALALFLYYAFLHGATVEKPSVAPAGDAENMRTIPVRNELVDLYDYLKRRFVSDAGGASP